MSANDIRSFTADIDRMIGDVNDKAGRVWRGTCSTVSENVKVGGTYGPGTPVDTSFAVNSWVEGINREGESHQPSSPPKRTFSVDSAGVAVPLAPKAIFDFRRLKIGDTFFLTSNCVYMRALDYGHSQQAPNGHVRLVTAALPQIVAEQVALVRT